MRLNLNAPIQFSNHFFVPIDETEWPVLGYRTVKTRKDKSGGKTPIRSRATFKKWANSLREINNGAPSLGNKFGLYCLIFQVPFLACYVGIAAPDSPKPEGILRRIKKHRVKATGSHVGGNGHGGVHHPKSWQDFAEKRAAYFADLELDDDCCDAWLIVGEAAPPWQLSKQTLEAVESYICENPSLLHAIVGQVSEGAQNIHLLTSHVTRRQLPERLEVVDCKGQVILG